VAADFDRLEQPLCSRMDGTYVSRLTSLELRERFDALGRERHDLRVTELILGNRIAEWIHAVAVPHFPALAELVPPFPPVELRQVVSDWQLEMFLWTGYVDAQHVAGLMDEWLPADHSRILDFGAGCGRLLRFFGSQGPSIEIHGAEVNPAQVAWCRSNLGFVRMAEANERPPLPYPDSYFDCVYAISVMTHLDRSKAEAWRDEYRRIVKPGGIVVLTTHGHPVLERIAASSTLQEWFRMSETDVLGVRSRLTAEGHVFIPYRSDVIDLARAGSDYGTSFTDPGFAQSWLGGAGFEVAQQKIAGLRGWQDTIVLRKSPAVARGP
jgi:SAM-dependent methyltransferase